MREGIIWLLCRALVLLLLFWCESYLFPLCQSKLSRILDSNYLLSYKHYVEGGGRFTLLNFPPTYFISLLGCCSYSARDIPIATFKVANNKGRRNLLTLPPPIVLNYIIHHPKVANLPLIIPKVQEAFPWISHQDKEQFRADSSGIMSRQFFISLI